MRRISTPSGPRLTMFEQRLAVNVAGRGGGMRQTSLACADRKFNTTLGPLHEDYRDRAVRLDDGSSQDSALSVWLPGAEDLAVSKLGRLSVVDVADILDLLRQPLASWETFEQLALEASHYYVGPDLASHIAYIKRKWFGEQHGDHEQ